MAWFTDGLRSVMNKLGVAGQDKAASFTYSEPSLTSDQLDNAYRTSFLAKRVVNIPAEDAFKKWRSWNAESDQIDAIEKEEARLGLKKKLMDASKEARLLGGAALYIGVEGHDPSEPFDPKKISKQGISYITPLAASELIAGDFENDPLSEFRRQPSEWSLVGSKNGDVKIHPSRLIRLVGDQHIRPTQVTSEFRGWGDPVLLTILDSILRAEGSQANVATLLTEANIDVVKIPDFMEGLAEAGYEKQIMDRMDLVNKSKSIMNMIIMDADEDFSRNSASFTGLDKLLMQYLVIVSAAAGIPVTHLLGISSSGLGSKGEGEMNVYYDRIQVFQEVYLRDSLSIFDEALIHSALGARPDDIYYNWAPLEQINEKEQSEVADKLTASIERLNNLGIYSGEEMRELSRSVLSQNSAFIGIDQIEDLEGDPNSPPDIDLGEEGEGDES